MTAYYMSFIVFFTFKIHNGLQAIVAAWMLGANLRKSMHNS